MSLLVATSKLNENTMPLDSEKPSSFTNFFRSPIEIPPNSEIAVESVKLERSGNVTIGNRDFVAHYFGTDPDILAEDDEFEELTSFSRTIRFDKGNYSMTTYPEEIESKFNTQYAHPNIFNNVQCLLNTNASGLEQGLQLKFTDRGSASGTNVSASLTATAVFNIANPRDRIVNEIVAPSSNFTWNSASGIISRTGTSSPGLYSLENSSCVVMLKGHPFGVNKGRFDVSLTDALARPWVCGLSRPQIQWETYESESASIVRNREIQDIDYDTAMYELGDVKILDYQGAPSIRGTFECYDYALVLDDVDKVRIIQRVWDTGREVSQHQELEYWSASGGASDRTSAMTKSQFYASFDGVRFQGNGDEIYVYFKDKNKTTYKQIIGSNLTSGAGFSYTPLGDTSCALYPMFNIGSGSMTISKYESNYSTATNTYAFPSYTSGNSATSGYFPGDDPFSNEAVFGWTNLRPSRIHIKTGRQLASNTDGWFNEHCDSSQRKWMKASRDALETLSYTYSYVGLNAANCVNFKHIICLGPMRQDNTYYTLLPSQEFPTMGTRFGFYDRVDIASTSGEGYVSGDDSALVTFISPSELQKTSISSFVRLPGLTHKSFNGGQSSISKIVYQVPQFTNDGRQFGPLYFAPGEKTYIALNNPAPIMLNSLQVQIVDSQEKELNSLMGTTQIVFHIRKMR